MFGSDNGFKYSGISSRKGECPRTARGHVSRLKAAASTCMAVFLVPMICMPSFSAAFAVQGESRVEAFALTAADVAAMPQFAGHELIAKYLDGYDLSLEDIAKVDLVALRDWNAKLADDIVKLRELLEFAQSGSGDQGTGDGVGSGESGDGSESSSGSDGESGSGSDEGTGTSPGGSTDAVEGEAGSEEDSDDASTDGFGSISDELGVSAEEAAQIEDPFAPSDLYPEWSYDGSTDFDMVHYTEDMDSHKFVATVAEIAREVGQQYDVHASQLIAEALVLSDAGQVETAQAPARNLFGATCYSDRFVKGYDEFGIADPSLDSVAYDLSDEVCEYDTYKACFEDRAQRLSKGIETQRFTVEVVYVDNEEEETEKVDAAVAAEEMNEAADPAEIETKEVYVGKTDADTEYAQAVQKVIEDFDLTRYDEALTYETIAPLKVKEWSEEEQEMVDVEVSLTDLVDQATSHLGVPYVWGGTTPSGFDCSGLVQYSYRHALQMNIARTTYYQCTVGQDVNFDDLHMGDLLFFVNNGVCGHVAMYLGEGCYIEAPRPGMEVKVTTMAEKKPTFAKRYIATQEIPEEELAARAASSLLSPSMAKGVNAISYAPHVEKA